MRELSSEEINRVSGGYDGIALGGNYYISGTRRIFNGFGAAGALGAAFEVGYAVGTGINYGIESMFDGNNAGDAIYQLSTS